MAKYYVNKNAQINGDHEVHKEDCNFLPDFDNRKYIGNFLNCHSAVVEAKNITGNQMDVNFVQTNVIPDSQFFKVPSDNK